jgi:hypothetical protein
MDVSRSGHSGHKNSIQVSKSWAVRTEPASSASDLSRPLPLHRVFGKGME